jgi:hypothetical protein
MAFSGDNGYRAGEGSLICGENTGKIRCAARRAKQALLQVWRVKSECAGWRKSASVPV